MPFRPTAPLLKKTSKSSTLWLARQYKDPYVKARLSNPINYRSRSAFKLLEVESRFKFLNDFFKEAKRSVETAKKTKSKRATQRSFNVVDLGAAPGGWSQVIAAKLGLVGEEPDEATVPRRSPKRSSYMAEWNEEMSKRRKMSGVFDEIVDDEIVEMEDLSQDKTTNDWSTPPSLKSKKFGLDKQSGEPNFDEMDPLDYLNARDLDQRTSVERSPSLPINLVALDLLPISPLPGVHSVQMDFLSPDAPGAVISLLEQLNRARAGKATPTSPTRVDLILSDLSPPHTGNRIADVSHSVTLLRAVWDFARKTLKTRKEYHLERVRQAQWIRQDVERQYGLTGTGQDVNDDVLKEDLEKEVDEELESVRGPQNSKSILRYGGILVLKHFAHPLSTSFCRVFLNPYFSKIHYFKPPASRTDSSEGYWVCIGWRGVPENVTMEALEDKLQRDVEAEEMRQIEKKKDDSKAKVIAWEEDYRHEMDREVTLAMDPAASVKAEKIIAGEVLRPDELLGLKDEMSISAPDGSHAPPDQSVFVTTTSELVPSAQPSSSRASASTSQPVERRPGDASQVVIDWRPKPERSRQ